MSGDIDKFTAGLKTRLRRFKEEFGVEFLERVRQRTPVQSGALQKGWGFRQKQDDIEIWNVEPYAAYVEYGTDKMEPRAMLRTTLLEKEEIAAIAIQRSKR